jgi:hypothetical protein
MLALPLKTVPSARLTGIVPRYAAILSFKRPYLESAYNDSCQSYNYPDSGAYIAKLWTREYGDNVWRQLWTVGMYNKPYPDSIHFTIPIRTSTYFQIQPCDTLMNCCKCFGKDSVLVIP